MDASASETDYSDTVLTDEEWLTDAESEDSTDLDNESNIGAKRKSPSLQGSSDHQKSLNPKRKHYNPKPSSSSKPRSTTGSDHTAPNPEPTDNKDVLLVLFKELIENLKTHGKSFADLLLFIFKPKRRGDTTALRRKHFWAHKKEVQTLLDYWAHSHQSKSGRRIFLKWVRRHAGRELRAEARKVTASGILRTSIDKIKPEYLHEDFKVSRLLEEIQKSCPRMVQMMLNFISPKGTRRKLSELSRVGQTSILCALTVLLRQHSQRNNLFQTYLGLYMFGIGLQRQGYDILSHLGTLISYSNLVRGKTEQDINTQPETTARASRRRANGALKMLAGGCRKLTKQRWKKRRHGIIFDNFNFTLKTAQQALGHTDSQENGTCATIFELHNATPEALDYAAARTAFAEAGPLRKDHIIHNETERDTHRKLMVHAIARIVLKYGGEELKQYWPLLDASQPTLEPVISVHTSTFYPLPAMDIDESSISGVISVFEAIFKELEIDINAEEFIKELILTAGDLKSGLNLLGAQDSRIGQEEPKNSLGNLEYVLGLFHTKMAAVVGLLDTHLGDQTAGQAAPGSLFFHNSILERKAFTPTSLPSFAIAKDLIMDSLAARIIHCLLRVSGCKNLESYLARLKSRAPTAPASMTEGESAWSRLLDDAEKLYSTYVDTVTASKLQSDRIYADPEAKVGDMVYEGAVFFLRDALNLEELFDAVKCGHSGRILSVLKLFALSFRGSGRPQYARALLRLIHYCEVVWPPKLRDLILQNWLANPTGRPKSFVELDLVQEHLIYWIKRVYSAHGSNDTWDWLTMITPCIGALRTLTKDLNEMLGNYRTTHHSSPDKIRDILKLIESLEKYEVYEIKEGRTFDDKCKPVVDAQSLGLEGLFWGNQPGLREYNREFKTRQKAYRGPDIAHTVPHTEFPRYPGSTAVGQSSSTDLAPETGLAPNPMETDWANNELEGGKEGEDGSDSEPEEEEHFDAILPLENEDDVSLEVNAADMWDIIYGLEREDEFEWDGDETV